ncbi:MAG: hypothetical protein WCK02_15045 [Bacteroidota bacterium]
MENNIELVEILIEKTKDYAKSSLELFKLKALRSGSDYFSTILPNILVLAVLLIFFLFFDLALAFWIGDMLGKIYLGFFIVAAFYGISAIFIYCFLRKWLKRYVSNCIIKNFVK